MAIKSYTNFEGNTFSGPDRTRIAAVTKKLWRKHGWPDNPVACDLCDQSEGLLMWHNEDYSTLLENIWALCWRCHMMWHSRRRSPDAVREYFEGILNEDRRWPPVYRHDFSVLARDHNVR